MQKKELNAAESVELIARMIDNTRRHLERNAGMPFLVWGYATVATTAAVAAALLRTGDPRWHWLWLAIPLLGWAGMLVAQRRQGERHVRTFIDRVVSHIWTVFGISSWAVVLPAFLGTAERMPVLPVILLLMGMGTTLTGLVIRFSPLTAGGIVAIVLSPALLVAPDLWNPLLFGAGFALMMIVPGHILNYRSNRPKDARHE